MLNWLKGLWNRLPFRYKFKIRYYHEQFLEPESDEKQDRNAWVRTLAPVVKPRDLHFRCPYCGQAHKMICAPNIQIGQDYTNGYSLQMQVDGSAVGFPSPEWNDVAYDLIDHPERTVVCEECGEEDAFWKWNAAYHQPLFFFEMDQEHLCHCGGEMYMEHLTGTDQYILRCERENCRWIRPNSKVSGAPGQSTGEGEVTYELRINGQRSPD